MSSGVTELTEDDGKRLEPSMRLGLDRPSRSRFFSTAVRTIGDHLNDVRTGDIEYVGHMDKRRVEPMRLWRAVSGQGQRGN